jgi:hypothetical protein
MNTPDAHLWSPKPSTLGQRVVACRNCWLHIQSRHFNRGT